MVRGVRYLAVLNGDAGEVTEAVDAIAGQTDQATVVPAGLCLAHLAANDLVSRAQVTLHLDSAHISPLPGRCLQNDGNPLVRRVHHVFGLNACKRIAKITEEFGKTIQCLGHG